MLTEDQIDGFAQVRCLSEPVGTLILGRRAVVHQNAMRAECLRGQNITHPVSDPPAAPKVNPELFGGLAVQKHTRLATIAWARELGQMRTEVVRIQMRALGL